MNSGEIALARIMIQLKIADIQRSLFGLATDRRTIQHPKAFEAAHELANNQLTRLRDQLDQIQSICPHTDLLDYGELGTYCPDCHRQTS